MEDSRDIPKAHGTEAERLAAEAAAEAGWRWPRVRMMAQSPDLQRSTPQPQQQQQQQQQPKRRSVWSQVRRFVSEVTEVFNDCDNHNPPVGSHAAAEHQKSQHAAALIVAAWSLLVAVDWALTSMTMPRIVEKVSAQPWTLAADLSNSLWWWANDALAWAQISLVEISVAMTHPFALEWYCFCAACAVLLVFETSNSQRRVSERAWLWLTYVVLSLVADMALEAVLGPPTAVSKDRLGSSSAGCRPAPHAMSASAGGRRAWLLQQAVANQRPAPGQGRGIALFATASMYLAVGLQLRASSGVRLRISAALLAADLGLRRISGTGAALMGQSARHLAEHVIVISMLLVLREAAVAVQAMRSWHGAVVRERRRGGPLMMIQESVGKTVSRLTDGGAYTHRVCFLCLSGFCERCLLSMEIWPTTGNAGLPADQQPEPLVVGLPGNDEQQPFEADSAAEPLPVSPTRPVVPILAAGRRRVRKNGRTTVSTSDQAALTNGLPLGGDALPTLGLPSPAPATAFGGRRCRAMDMWIISSVAHCPCRSVHGPGPSAFVSKAQSSSNEGRADSRFEMPVGSVVGLAQYVAELRSLGLVRPVNQASMSQSDDFAASIFPYIFGRFAVPAHKGLATPDAAASALAVSNMRASGHTPATAPVFSAASASAAAGEKPGVSRILMASTPLSLARNAESAGTFRLNAVAVNGRTANYGACVVVSVVMTPALAHLLLSHPKTAPTAAVCVPAALLSPTKTVDNPPVVSDADPFLDYTRVQVARSDVVVRVNSARWLHYELGPSALNQPITVSHLPVDVPPQPLAISLTICGMCSEDLCVFIKSAKTDVTLAGDMPVALDKGQELVAEAEAGKAKLAAATQSLKRAKREAPKTVAHWEAQLEAVRKSLDRNAFAETKLESKRRHLELAVGALRTTVQALSEESEAARRQENNDGVVPSDSNHQLANDALKSLRSAETEAHKQREAHARVVRELDAERTAWKARLSEVVQETEPLERALVDPLQRELRDVSRKFLVARNVEAKLQAKLHKELAACNDLAKARPSASACSGHLADIKESIAKEKAEINWYSKM